MPDLFPNDGEFDWNGEKIEEKKGQDFYPDKTNVHDSVTTIGPFSSTLAAWCEHPQILTARNTPVTKFKGLM